MFQRRSCIMRVFLFLTLLVMILAMPVMCFAEEEETTWLNEANAEYELTYDGIEFVVTEGGTLQLHAVCVADKTQLDSGVIWLSSSPNIASVDKAGLITGKCTGKAEISCLSLDGKTTYVKTSINVVPGVKNITISDNAISLLLGTAEAKAQKQLTANILPEDAYFHGVTWTSSDENIATIDKNGIIQAKGIGTCIVSLTSDDNGFLKQVQCEVSVLQAVTGIDVSCENIIWTGSSCQIEPVISPGNTTIQDVLWESTDPAVASVDAKGIVRGNAVGTATIKCTSTDGSDVVGECTVQVEAKTQKIGLVEKNINLLIGAGEKHSDSTLTILTTPKNAYYQTAVWTSSDENVVTVDAEGNLHAVSLGTAEITAISSDPDCKAKVKCKVVVSKAVDSITLDKSEMTAYTGTSVKLSATIGPDDASSKNVVWSSSDPAIATVDAKGIVRCNAVGVCEITCAATDGSEIAASCSFDIIAKVKGLTLSETTTTLLIGAGDKKLSKKLSFTTNPIDAYYQNVVWASSDESVVTVDPDGTIHAAGIGTATISAISDDPEYNTPATCQVSVNQAVMIVALNEHEITMFTGEATKLEADISPDAATNKKLVWESANPEVASVNANGNVKAVTVGNTEIVCKAADGSGIVDTCAVTVRSKVKGVKLDQSKLELVVGNGDKAATGHLEFTVQPENAYIKTVSWTSSDENIATVDSYGIIRAVNAGTAIISAISDDPEYNTPATCQVFVGTAVSSIKFIDTKTVMSVNSSQVISTEISPAEATNKKLTWESSNTDVLTVDGKGNVRAVGNGSADIICTAQDGTEVKQKITISVIRPVAQITPSQREGYIFVNSSAKLSATVSPADATNKAIEWESDSTCVSVNADGVVTGMRKGTATITGTAKDGSGVKCTIKVTVEPEVPVVLSNLQCGTGLLTYGTLNFTFKNICSSVGIKEIVYTVRLSGTAFLLTKSENTFTLSNLSMRPGGTVMDSNYFPKYKDAKHITVTIKSVILADGTIVKCNDSSHYDIS